MWGLWKRRPGRPKFNGPDNSSIESFLRSYCADYKVWNDHCIAISEATERRNRPAMMNELSKIYGDCVRAYTVPGVSLQSIAYGSESNFDPHRLSFGNIETNGNCTKQTFFIRASHGDHVDEYLAHLVTTKSDEFQLEQIYYIDAFPEHDAEGKPPMLPCL